MSDAAAWDKGNWFVAFPLEAAGWLPAMRVSAPPAMRMFDVADVHMTLAFLGRLGAEQIEKVLNEFAQISTDELKPLSLRLDSLMLLPQPERFSAVSWSLKQGAGGGRELAAEYIGGLRPRFYAAAGVKADARSPLPHITVGRPKRAANTSQRSEIASWSAAVKPPDIELNVKSLALYCWARDRGVRQFHIWHSQALV